MEKPSSVSPPEPNAATADEHGREDWMSLPTSFLTSSNLDRRKEREEAKRQEKERDKYDPRKNIRELNPYWKDGGDGLPKFKKPREADDENQRDTYKSSSNRNRVSNWKKQSHTVSTITKKDGQKEDIIVSNVNTQETNKNTEIMSEKDLNALAAKLVKAEIMGNAKLIAELKEKLERARSAKNVEEQDQREVLLTQTDSKGYSQPIKLQSQYGEHSGSKRKKQKLETHAGGERVRYFADDDKYSLKQMFENEKFNSVDDQNREFAKLAGKIAKNDDLDDIFTDKIRHKESSEKMDKRMKDRAVSEHQNTARTLDNCAFCLQSTNMPKHLMISMNETFYLSLPQQEPLTDGHCLLIPIRHIPCITQLDENEWSDLMDFRKALTKMFNSQDEDVIFFETAMNLSRYPHTVVHCVPLPKEQGDLAPIYFKKAIDESETEWSSNKKLVSLKGRDVRKAIPKGLEYFSVSFGMEEGYAHVIEDQRLFPGNFAQEIIGGMLDLHHSKWKNPKRQRFEEQSKRVVEFNKTWSKFDCTTSQ